MGANYGSVELAFLLVAKNSKCQISRRKIIAHDKFVLRSNAGGPLRTFFLFFFLTSSDLNIVLRYIGVEFGGG